MTDFPRDRFYALIEGQARMESKLDGFIKTQEESARVRERAAEETKAEIAEIKKDVGELKTKWKVAAGVISIFSASVGSLVVFFGQNIRSFFGL